jgi:hypothetical protein
VASSPKPKDGLLAPCVRPAVIDRSATDTDIGLFIDDAVSKYLACERKHDDVVKWVQGVTK